MTVPPLIPGDDCDETVEWDGEEETIEEGTWPWHSSEEEGEGENGHAEIKDELDDDDELDAESDESDDNIDIGEVEKLIAMVTKDPLVVPLDAGWRREVVTR